MRSPSLRRRAVLSVLGTVVVAFGIAAILAGRRGEFTSALATAPLWILGAAIVLQLVALLARTEAWYTCVRATGATVPRRLLFRAAGVGYLASVLNGSLGMAARIASLRRVAPESSPRIPALLAAEVPIISIEVALAAVFSFTLIGPLGVPWWAPVIAVLATVAAVVGLRRVSDRHQLGFWAGLSVMRTGRGQMTVLVLLAVCAQIARNWLLLRGIGSHASLIDAVALLIAMFTLGQLPIGPSLGAAAAVLILGAHGVGTAAAAGVLLTATATAGSLCYAGWAVADRLLAGRLVVTPDAAVAPGRA